MTNYYQLTNWHGLFFTPYHFDSPERWQFLFQEAATQIMDNIIDLHHDIISFLIAPEVIWILVPAVILVFIALPSYILIYNMDELIDPKITLKVIGHQWYWAYEYSDMTKKSLTKEGLTFESYMLLEKKKQMFIPFMLLNSNSAATWGQILLSSQITKSLLILVFIFCFLFSFIFLFVIGIEWTEKRESFLKQIVFYVFILLFFFWGFISLTPLSILYKNFLFFDIINYFEHELSFLNSFSYHRLMFFFIYLKALSAMLFSVCVKKNFYPFIKYFFLRKVLRRKSEKDEKWPEFNQTYGLDLFTLDTELTLFFFWLAALITSSMKNESIILFITIWFILIIEATRTVIRNEKFSLFILEFINMLKDEDFLLLSLAKKTQLVYFSLRFMFIYGLYFSKKGPTYLSAITLTWFWNLIRISLHIAEPCASFYLLSHIISYVFFGFIGITYLFRKGKADPYIFVFYHNQAILNVLGPYDEKKTLPFLDKKAKNSSLTAKKKK